MNLKNKNILVTGGLGFVGGHLVDALLEKGANITILDRCARNKWSIERYINEENCKIIIGDIINKNNVWDAMSGVDIVFNLAAQPLVPESIKHPDHTAIINVRGMLNVLEAAREENIKKFIHMSSCEVYGNHGEPINLDSQLLAHSPYACSKLLCDRLAHSWYKTYDMPITIVRPFNIYGPRDLTPSRIIPATIMKLIRGEQPIIEGEGKQIRDFNYVTDVVGELINLLEYTNYDKPMNIGSCNAFNMREIITKIQEIFFRDTPIKPKILIDLRKERKGEVMKMVCDTSMLYSNYRPKTNIETGLKLTINWFKENKKLWK